MVCVRNKRGVTGFVGPESRPGSVYRSRDEQSVSSLARFGLISKLAIQIRQ